MPKTQTDYAADTKAARPAPPPLSANIRRHLGSNLRNLYAQSLCAPMGERIETLMNQLETLKR